MEKIINIDEKINKISAKELTDAIKSNHIKIYSVQNNTLVEQLYGRLHRGELEVMFAAEELD